MNTSRDKTRPEGHRQARAALLRTELRSILLEAFDFVQIINLKERRDRRNEMDSELRRIGLSLRDDHVELLEASRFPDAGGFASIGARGCFDSHLKALERAQRLRSRATLILEDDCDFSNQIQWTLPFALAALERTRWSVFYGGRNDWIGRVRDDSPIAPASPTDTVLGSHFVAFSSEAVTRLIPFLTAMRERPAGSPEGGPMHVDGAYDWFRAAHPQLEAWMANPVLGRQRPSRTDVHELKPIERVALARNALSLMRRARRALGKLRKAPGAL